MIAAVADTHTSVWYLFGDSRLSPKARETLDDLASAGQQVAVSTITLAEIVYLVEKDRLAEAVLDRIFDALESQDEMLVEAPVDQEVVRAMRSVTRAEIPDLPDRIIAATALHLGVPLLTRDPQITASRVEVIW